MGSRSGSAGRNVGVAMGTIRINTGQLVSDANRATTAMRSISDEGAKIGQGVQQGTRQAQASLNSLNATAADIAKRLAGMFALPTMVGFTQQVQRADFLIRELSGSQELANERMDQLRKLADRTNQSFIQLQQSAVGLLPAIARNNVDLEQTVLLAQRLAILDPAQGIEGATYAIRELLGGSIVSLAARFEMPRGQLNDLLGAANGDPQEIINGLDRMVAQMGITEDSIVRMGEEGFNAFSNLKGEVMETTALAFEPFLENAVLPLVEGMGELIREARNLNPELLAIAGTLGGILATMTAINAAGMGSPGLNRLVGGAAGAFVGVEAGTAIARFGSESGGFQNSALENVSQQEAKEVIATTFKQMLVAAASTLIDLFSVFQTAQVYGENQVDRFVVTLQMVVTSLEMLQAVIDTGADNTGTVLKNAADIIAASLERTGLDLVDAVADVIAALGELLIELPLGGAVDRRGQSLIDSATSGQSGRDNRRDVLDARVGADVTEGVRPVREALLPFIDEMQTLIDVFAQLPDTLTPEQAAAIAEENEALKQSLIPLADALGLLGDEAEETAVSVNEAAQGVSQVEVFTAEMLEAFAKFQEEIATLEAKAAEDRKKAIDDATRRRADAYKKMEQGINEAVADATSTRAETITEFNENTEKAERDHRDRLAAIHRSTREAAIEAAASFDARGLFRALRSGRNATANENLSFDKANTERERQLQKELASIETSGQQRIAKLRANYAEELAAINEQQVQKLAQIDAQLKQEIETRNLRFAELHNQMVAESGNHNIRMLNIQSAGTRTLEQQYAAWLARMGAQMGYMTSQVSSQLNQMATSVRAAPPQTLQAAARGIPTTTAAPRTGTSGFRFTRTFNVGTGRVPSTGIYQLEANEAVLTPPVAAMLRSMTGSQNPTQAQMQNVITQSNQSSGKSISVQWDGNVSITGDVGNWSELKMKTLAKEAFIEALEEVVNV